MANKKVSVLVPVYGVERYIERCARSLFEQTYDNIEYIFVNDCTKDHSIDILKSIIARYPSRSDNIRIINHEYNRGLSAARNTGINACRGDYILHVDSDDWLELNAIELLVNKAVESNADIVLFSNYNVFKNHTIKNTLPQISKEQYIKGVLRHSIPASIWNKFYNAAFYKASNIKSVEGLNHGEDYVVVPRLVYKASSFVIYNEALYNYNRTNENSYMKNISTESIKNLHLASDILYEYFTHIDDSEIFKSEVECIYYRTMLALMKLAKPQKYEEIYNAFQPNIKCIKDPSVTDEILLLMAKFRQWEALGCIVSLYNKIKND